MEFSITEQQKRIITLALTLCISILMFNSLIMPLRTKIEENTATLEVVEVQEAAFREVVENVTIDLQYQILVEETQQTFEENYQSFAANEKIEEILSELGISLKALSVGEYTQIDASTYEKKVAQPENLTEYDAMQEMLNSDIMPLFLMMTIQITVEADADQQLAIINAINNVEPEGPGDDDTTRYCMEVESISYDTSKSGTVSYSIIMYGMEAPPIY